MEAIRDNILVLQKLGQIVDKKYRQDAAESDKLGHDDERSEKTENQNTEDVAKNITNLLHSVSQIQEQRTQIHNSKH